jgi:integrase
MACKFYIKKGVKSGMTPIFTRIRSVHMTADIRIKTGIEVDAKRWNAGNSTPNALANYRSSEDAKPMFEKLDAIDHAISYQIKQGVDLTYDQVKEIIEGIVFAEEIAAKKAAEEEARRLEEEAKKMTLNKFIDQYLKDIKSGRRQSDRGKAFAPATVIAINQTMTQFKGFQKKAKREFNFDDIDLEFYNDYVAYLKKRNYSINSIGKCIKQFKTIMSLAESEGYHNNAKYKDKRFKGTRVEVDSIYLTRKELEKIMKVPAKKLSPGKQLARDIFMIGVWTAQRVSDYNNIKPEDIHTTTKRWIEDVPNPKKKGETMAVIKTKEITYIDIRQQKTGAKVSIPCSTELLKILKKYDFNVPHLPDQDLNRYMKDIAELAGLTDEVEIETTKGGKSKLERIPKYKLVHSHTARRTGATLMYLAGIDIYDIMKVTGHASPEILKKYIKADNLDVAQKLSDKYDYFA